MSLAVPATGLANGARGSSVGTKLGGAKAMPNGPRLSRTKLNRVRLTLNPRFRISVKNTGTRDLGNVKVKVSLRGPRGSRKAINRARVIRSLPAGQRRAPKFWGFCCDIDIGVPLRLVVSIDPVPGEQNIANNSARFKIIFTVT